MANSWDKPEGGDYATYQQAKESAQDNQVAVRETNALSGVYAQAPQTDWHGTKDAR